MDSHIPVMTFETRAAAERALAALRMAWAPLDPGALTAGLEVPADLDTVEQVVLDDAQEEATRILAGALLNLAPTAAADGHLAIILRFQPRW